MITSTTAKMTYTVVEGVTSYAIGFMYNWNPNSTPQIKVFRNKLLNTQLVYGTNYTISDDGLSVVLLSGVSAGDRLDIIRDIPLVQISDYVIGRIDPEQIESDMDLAVMRDQQLKGDLDFAIEIPEDHEARIQECEIDIEDIESLIPNQATDTNQLADKDFVNSSIATSTATFRGTYDTLAELEEVTADENDYGFVVSIDAVGNTLYSRYKYANSAWVFEYNLNNSSFTADQWAAINSGITQAIVESLNATTGKNVGEVFMVLRNDNELRGAVECDGDTYNTTDFIGADAIGAKLEAGKIPYVSLAQYATLLAANGSVGVFGWDGAGTTPFRVPSLNDVFIETGTTAEIGDYLAPKIPNIKSSFVGGISVADGAMYTEGTSTTSATGIAQSTDTRVRLDASRVSGVYDDTATTVQPSAIRMRFMVQLAIAATDEALETCTGVTADVAGLKAHEVIEFQAPTAQNNYTWYRKYRDGWVEQGGVGTTSLTVTFPVTMSDTNYTIALACNNYSANAGTAIAVYYDKATTGFNLQGRWNGNAQSGIDVCWEVKGMYAQN